MKKMKFLLPKILGATVVVGVATLFMAAIFKVLVLASVVAIVASLIGRKMSRRRMMYQGYDGYAQGLGHKYQAQEEPTKYQPDYKMPFGDAQRRSGILPIN